MLVVVCGRQLSVGGGVWEATQCWWWCVGGNSVLVVVRGRQLSVGGGVWEATQCWWWCVGGNSVLVVVPEVDLSFPVRGVADV